MKITKAILAKVEKRLRSEVATYNQYLTGDVWGYTVEADNDTGWVGDSCWGFYGQEDAIAEAKSVIDYRVEEKRKEKLAKTKAFIKNHVPLEYRMAV